jgi:DNA-binding NarL/FixJ family response regulator
MVAQLGNLGTRWNVSAAAAVAACEKLALLHAMLGLSGTSVIEPQPDQQPVPPATQLTRREWEVAELIARGSSNREIATALVICERTAEAHVTHVLNKLGLRSRAQIAVWVAQQSPSVRYHALRESTWGSKSKRG